MLSNLNIKQKLFNVIIKNYTYQSTLLIYTNSFFYIIERIKIVFSFNTSLKMLTKRIEIWQTNVYTEFR